MTEIFIYTVVTLVSLGAIGAVVLYFVAQKFKVYEDPRIDVSEGMLPGANCGGCGFPGCRGLATALVEQDDISSLYCPVGGGDTMKAVADYLGKAAPEKEPAVAVVRCAGSYCSRSRTSSYDGASSCAVIASLYGGETDCAWGCLGKGDCCVVCNFDAIHINPETGLPEVDAEKCTACGACVKACPKMVIELRKKGIKGRRIYVSCINKDKGAVTRKACSVGCIGCGKCVKACAFDAITLANNLAYIDPAKCKLCRKCAGECPTGAIIEVGFPVRVPKDKDSAVAAVPASAKKLATDDVKAPASAKAETEVATTQASVKVETETDAAPVPVNAESATVPISVNVEVATAPAPVNTESDTVPISARVEVATAPKVDEVKVEGDPKNA